MPLSRLMPLFIIAGIAATVHGAPQAAPLVNPVGSAAPVGAMRIAIANPSRIFTDMQETKILREKLEARRKELLAREMEQRQAIEALIAKRKSYNPKHPDYAKISDQIDNAKAQLQAWGMATKASVDRDQKMMVRDLYEKIEGAVGEVAQQNGIDLVIADGRQEFPDLEEVPTEDLRRILNGRNVLYSGKNVDISEQVITLLDRKLKEKP